jgi:hypothetical protein
MKRLLRAWILFLMVAVAALPAAAAALPNVLFGSDRTLAPPTTATIASDKPDYHPGEVVNLTGSGWHPGEIVSIVMVVSPLTHPNVRLTSVADANGNFTNSSYVVQMSDRSVKFNVTATGDKGFTAQTTFTDSDTTTVTITGNGTVADNQGPTINCTGTGGTLTGTCNTSYGGGTGTVTLTATAASGYVFSSWTNSGNVTCTPSGNTCSFTTQTGSGHTVTVNATFVLSLSAPAIAKSFTPTSIAISGTSVLKLTITNPNAGTALNGVGVTDPLPSGVQVASTPGIAISGCGSPTFAPIAGATSLTFSGGTIAASGTCTASVNVTATTAGSKVNTTNAVTSTNGGTGGTATATLTVYGPATKLVFVTQPSNTVAGAAITPAVTVQVQDASGNVVQNSSAPVTMTIGTNPGGGTLGGTTTVNAVNGVATFSTLSINKTGTGYTLSAASSGLSGATSSTFNITPGTATQLVFTTQPSSSANAGTPFATQPTITVEDANSNTVTGNAASITLAIGTNPSGGTLTCTTNPLGATNGVATFAGCSINLAGNGYTLTAASAGLTGATSAAINVSVGPAAKLIFVQQPTNTVEATAIAPGITVQVQDAGGNVVNSSSASIAMTIGTNPGGGTLSGTTTVNANGTSGLASFSTLSINKTGTGYTLVASSSGLTSATSSGFNITPGTATQLVFTTQPSAGTAAGTAFATQPTVTVQDANGNTVTSSSASITLAIGTNPGGGTLTCTTNPKNATNGVDTFAGCSINKTGNGYTLTATSSGLATATSNTFNITPGAATQLVFTTQPSSTANGATAFAQQPVVTVEDANGNTVTSSNASITLAIGTNPSGGTLTCTTNPLAATNGVAAFGGCSINLAGNGYTLTAAASGLTGATSTTINIAVGSATKLVFGTQPSNSAAGAAITPAVTAKVEDAGGNVVSSSASITMAIGTNPSGGTLSGTTTANAVNGTATFSTLSIDKSGTGYTLTASSSGLTGATSSAFSIAASTATQLVFTTQPSSSASGGAAFPQQPTITVEDAFGNTVTTGTGSTAPVTLAITNGTGTAGATLTCTTNPKNAVTGVDTFAGCKINLTGGGYTLLATSSGLTSATSTAINVSVGSATQLAFGTQPSNTAAGSAITPAVTVLVEDAGQNVVNSSASITIAIGTNPSGGTLSGTTTVNAVNGTATFSTLSINKSGTAYTLNATSAGVTAASSSAFNITTGAATKLVFGTQPSNTAQGFPISPVVTVQVEDAGSNIVTTSSASITVAIGTNPGSGTLSGTTTVSAVSGVATYSGLSINNLGTGYTLTASATGLTGATSSSFNIVVPIVTYTQPFNSGHGWTYTQTACSVGTFGSCSNSINVSTTADCQAVPCVDSSAAAGLQTGGDQTGYFQSPIGSYTWQTLGVPANATVTSVEGGWWDFASGCAAGTAAGIQIFNSTNSAAITSADVQALTAVQGDTAAGGVTHALGTAVTVNSGFGASSTGLTVRFNLNSDTSGFFGTCTLYGDSFQLLISYTSAASSTGPKRHGQVIIGWNRTPQGTMANAGAYNVELSSPEAASLTLAGLKFVRDGRNGIAFDPRSVTGNRLRITPLKLAKD